ADGPTEYDETIAAAAVRTGDHRARARPHLVVGGSDLRPPHLCRGVDAGQSPNLAEFRLVRPTIEENGVPGRVDDADGVRPGERRRSIDRCFLPARHAVRSARSTRRMRL